LSERTIQARTSARGTRVDGPAVVSDGPTTVVRGRSAGGTLPSAHLGVGGTMSIGVQELFVLFIAFAVPTAVAAWMLRR
jgi:hypothetical protein